MSLQAGSHGHGYGVSNVSREDRETPRLLKSPVPYLAAGPRECSRRLILKNPSLFSTRLPYPLSEVCTARRGRARKMECHPHTITVQGRGLVSNDQMTISF